MIVASDLLGPLQAAPEDLIEFPGGLFGFPECRSFLLVPAEREGLYWLQSAEHSTLAFLLVDPFLHFDGYVVDVPPVEMQDLQVSESSDVVVLAIVTLPRTREERPTANLQGPLAINLRARVAKQLALSDTDYGVRSPFDPMRPLDGA